MTRVMLLLTVKTRGSMLHHKTRLYAKMYGIATDPFQSINYSKQLEKRKNHSQ